MRNLKELNMNEGGRPVKRKPPSDELFAELESLVEVRLPEDYKTLLRFSNGGHPELDTVLVDVNGRELLWNVNAFFYLRHSAFNTDDTENIFWIHAKWSSTLGPKRLAFANNGGGDCSFWIFMRVFRP